MDFGDFTGERKKFFVVLNDVSDDTDYFIAALTTSQGKRYVGETSAACGCPAASCYRLEDGEEQFEYETWIQYDNTVGFTRANLEDRQKKATGDYLRMLTADRIRSVLNCALKSVDLSGQDKGRIKKTLAAMAEKSAAAKAAKTLPPPSPIDLLKVDLEGHKASCRQEFCELVMLSQSAVAQILSKSTVAPTGFIENATLAMILISESCGCRTAGKKAT